MKILSGINKAGGSVVQSVFDFIHNYTLELILISFILLGICWGIGYFANAIYGMHFELQSCWAGFTAIGGAGVLAAVKYCMDSWKNTPEGRAPSYGMSASQRIATAMIDIMPHQEQPRQSEGEDKV